jgi:hypothetical protein
MATILQPKEEPGAGGITSRNATRINLRINNNRVGRVQSMGRSANNNVQVLRELGAQVAVELKKGISEYTFTIAKMWVHNDVIDELEQGAIFELETVDESAQNPITGSGSTEILDLFKYCAINSLDRQYTAGQATVAANVSVVVIGQPQGGQLSEG